MEIIDQPNSRLCFHFYKTISGEKIKLYPGDSMLFYSKRRMGKILKKQVSNPQKQLLIDELIKPNPGYLRIGTFYRVRSDSIGLWKVSLKSEFDI